MTHTHLGTIARIRLLGTWNYINPVRCTSGEAQAIQWGVDYVQPGKKERYKIAAEYFQVLPRSLPLHVVSVNNILKLIFKDFVRARLFSRFLHGFLCRLFCRNPHFFRSRHFNQAAERPKNMSVAPRLPVYVARRLKNAEPKNVKRPKQLQDYHKTRYISASALDRRQLGVVRNQSMIYMFLGQ